MSAHTGRLLLSPQDPFRLPALAPLAATLSDAGLIGPGLAGFKDTFYVGERFLQLVTFAGCSVRIALSPAGATPFCHIRFAGPFSHPVFRSGRNTRPPRCPNCRSPLQDWKQVMADWDGTGPKKVVCRICGEAQPPWAYDWKEKAGFGRLLIEIEEVFPGEASPTPGLMELLEAATGGKWRHFYLQDA